MPIAISEDLNVLSIFVRKVWCHGNQKSTLSALLFCVFSGYHHKSPHRRTPRRSLNMGNSVPSWGSWPPNRIVSAHSRKAWRPRSK